MMSLISEVIRSPSDGSDQFRGRRVRSQVGEVRREVFPEEKALVVQCKAAQLLDRHAGLGLPGEADDLLFGISAFSHARHLS